MTYSPSHPAVVVGGGLAGMFTALRIAEQCPVTLACKGELGWGATAWAQGGIAAAVGVDDSVSAHVRDTLAAGAGISDPRVAALVCAQAADGLVHLQDAGVTLDRDGGTLALSHEGAHSAPRVVHAGGDRTGAHIATALAAEVRAHPHITIHTHTRCERVLVDAAGVHGVTMRRPDGATEEWETRAVILATGGAGDLYARSTNPAGSSADGMALALTCGAAVADAEMIQFHPTALAVARATGEPYPLVSEAVRGAGAVLRDCHGTAFMHQLHPQGDLAPRDVVARAIWQQELSTGEGVHLDLTHLDADDVHARFPGVSALCAAHGLDLARDPIPVTPAAHYAMAGVLADDRGRSTVPGLWAVGECAATGLHGANRLASNSLLESVVLAARVADGVVAGEYAASNGPRGTAHAWALGTYDGHAVRARVGDIMWRGCGLVRDRVSLEWARDELARIPRADDVEAEGLRRVAQLVVRAALYRTESRGAHYRADFPQADDAWMMRIAWTDDTPTALRAPSVALAQRLACSVPVVADDDAADYARARVARDALGERVAILGHHYQKHAVMDFADVQGDSLELARQGAALADADTLVFCGVHFMAEAAALLARPGQRVVIPDPTAGCHLAECADIFTVRDAWQQLSAALGGRTLIPLTYMNSGADLKSFVGAHGGLVCTSSNAAAAFRWARERGDVTIFFPDEHLGRNTAVELGMAPDEPVVYDARAAQLGGIDPARLADASLVLWRGFCNVHVQFTPAHINDFRARHPRGVVLVHPECPYETVQAADRVGSTAHIINWVEQLPAGTAVTIGTDWNLVDRLRQAHPRLHVECLNEDICPCVTMNRITLPALADTLEALVRDDTAGVHDVTVPEAMAADARVALERMLELDA